MAELDLYAQYYVEWKESKEFIDLRFIEDDEIRSALELKIRDAIQSRVNAAYGGEMHDGGYSRKLALIDGYVAGWRKIIPGWLEDHIKEHHRRTDPEFAEYQRLKEKFE